MTVVSNYTTWEMYTVINFFHKCLPLSLADRLDDSTGELAGVRGDFFFSRPKEAKKFSDSSFSFSCIPDERVYKGTQLPGSVIIMVISYFCRQYNLWLYKITPAAAKQNDGTIGCLNGHYHGPVQ